MIIVLIAEDLIKSKETCPEDFNKNFYPTYCVPSITVGNTLTYIHIYIITILYM